MLVGGGLYLGLNAAFKGIVGGIYEAATHGASYKDNFWFESFFRLIRYIIIGFLIIGIYPLTFKYAEKLWKKLGWIKETLTDETMITDTEATLKSNKLAAIGFALSFVCGFAGLPISAIACKRTRKNGYNGKRTSIAGIAISIAWIAIFALCMLALACVLKGDYIIMAPAN